ncbi:MAG: T9SS type A sorting domain-containing protein [Candidatus Eisenbacteria bacterium]|nr:T9SS type A sorting domain-containing protein [Candidatus Eisenbacteria bacterium]
MNCARTIAAAALAALLAAGGAWAGAEDATIYEIQQGTYSQYTWVTVDSVIVTGVTADAFWVIEPAGGAYGGIYVARGENPYVSRGDLVTVSGYYTESSGLSNITATSGVGGIVNVLDNDQTLPAASAVAVDDVNTGSATAEQWEGCLVTLDDLACTAVNASDWRVVEVDGDAPLTDTLFVDDLMTYNWPSLGDTLVELTGLMHYLSGNFRLEPRDNYDVLVADTEAPAQITDLAASSGEYNGTVDLDWTAVGDDGTTGTASAYVVRWHTSPITGANWASANDVDDEPAPQSSGSSESWTVTGLPEGQTLYFAVRAEDEALLQGPVSNSPSAYVTDTQPTLVIHCINVGQGDCTLIVAGTGQSFLFDAGNNGVGSAEVVPYLDSIGINTLTYMGASHYDADHIGGLDEVFNSALITLTDSCYDRGWSYSTVTYDNYVAAIGSQRATAYDGLVLDLGGGVTMTCVGVNGNGQLSPPYDETYAENDLSVNWVVEVGNFQFYVGGDTPGYSSCYPYHDIETSIAQDVGNIEVVRANHHGSYCNTNQNLLNWMDPQAVIISVGDGNPYGHPKQDMINRVVSSGAYIYQTEGGTGGSPPMGMGEVCGDVVIRTNGLCTYTIQDSTYLVDDATGVELAGTAPPVRFGLLGNAPNPFNPVTEILFELPRAGEATLAIHDVSGRLVAVLSRGPRDAGTFRETWDGRDDSGRPVASGVYFARLRTAERSDTRKMVLVR